MSLSTDWEDDAKSLALQFRLGMSVPAAIAMVEFVQRLANQARYFPSPYATEFGDLVGKMLACQKSHDWLGLADYLDTELIDWLRRLQKSEGYLGSML